VPCDVDTSGARLSRRAGRAGHSYIDGMGIVQVDCIQVFDPKGDFLRIGGSW
jgi:hypothetical protein